MPIIQWAVLAVVLAVLLIAWHRIRRWFRSAQKLTYAILALQRSLESSLTPPGVLDRNIKSDFEWRIKTLEHISALFVDRVQSLMQSDALRRKMIASMTEDLRSPLTTFQGYLKTMQLKAGVLSAEQNERFLAIAIKHCYRLNKLVDEFHELSKLDCMEARPIKTLFSLTELAQHVLQKYTLVAQEKEIILKFSSSTLRHVVVADIGMIERVFSNLIDNALRFTPRGGEVTIKLREYRTRIKVQVTDTGKGIRRESLLQLFHGTARVTHTAEDKLTGVGLLVVKRILDLHNSEVKVDSEIGVGTTFYFDLPLAQAYAGE